MVLPVSRRSFRQNKPLHWEETAAALEILMGQGIALQGGDFEVGRQVLRQGFEVIN